MNKDQRKEIKRKSGDRFKKCVITTRSSYQGFWKPHEKYCRNNCKYHGCVFNHSVKGVKV